MVASHSCRQGRRIGMLMLVVCVGSVLLTTAGAQSTGCSMVMDTDIVVAVHDSASSMEFWWGRIVFSPAVVTFLRNLVAMYSSTPRVRMSLVAYGSTVRLLAPFTSDQQQLQNALNWRPQLGGARTYDAVSYITQHFRNNARPNTAKIAIFLTNRVSDNSRLTLFNTQQMKATEVAVLGIPFGPSPIGELRLMAGSPAQVTQTASSYHLMQSLGAVRNTLCSLAVLYNSILSQRNPPAATQPPVQPISGVHGEISASSLVLCDEPEANCITPSERRISPRTLSLNGARYNTVLVLDHSDSTRRFQGLTFYWAPALVQFGASLLDGINNSTGRCSTGLVAFSDDSTLLNSLGDDFQQQKDTLTTVAKDMTIPFSGSNITSAILLATSELSKNTDPAVQKNIVVVIDGSPTDSLAMREAAQAASDAGVTLYALSLQTLGGRAVTESTLLDIAQSPGRVDADLTDDSLPLKAPGLARLVCPAA